MNIKFLINIALAAVVLLVIIIFGSWFWGRYVILENLEQNLKELREVGVHWTPTENIKMSGFPFEYNVLISGDIYFDWENSRLFLEKFCKASEVKQKTIPEILSFFGEKSQNYC